MKYTFRPRGVCSQLMEIETDGKIIESLHVTGGCSGNLQGIASLIAGRDIDGLIPLLEGIKCGGKPTSCPDQLAQALKKLKKELAEEDA